jgi:hypothetical protein
LYVPEFGFCCVPEDAEEIILIIVVWGQLGHFISRLIEEEKKNSHAGIKPTPPPQGNGRNYFAEIKRRQNFLL